MNGKSRSRRRDRFSISILDSGTVRLNIGKGIQEMGNRTIFYGTDHEKLDHLLSLGLDVTRDMRYAALNSQASFICVPTPTVSARVDMLRSHE